MDDMVPEDVNLDDKLKALNSVDERIQFTVEKEYEGKIPFLDTLIMRSGRSTKFSVYCKPTNKEDYVYFFSGHKACQKWNCHWVFLTSFQGRLG